MGDEQIHSEGMRVDCEWRETVDAILTKSKRSFVPIDKSFIQLPRGNEQRKSVLSQFVTNGDRRGLMAYLLISASASSPNEGNEWSTSLPLQTWARAFGCYKTAGTVASGKSAATRIFNRLQGRHLIKREKTGKGRKVKVCLLAQDGLGGEYQRPRKRFVRLSYDFWREKYEDISLPAIAMLLVVLGEKQPCQLPAERMPEWYGWSADTAERGLRELRKLKIIECEIHKRKTPLSPTGYTMVNEYSVCRPFDQESLNSSRRRRSSQDGKKHE